MKMRNSEGMEEASSRGGVRDVKWSMCLWKEDLCYCDAKISSYDIFQD